MSSDEANRCQQPVKSPTKMPERGFSGQQIGRRPRENRPAASGRAVAGSNLLHDFVAGMSPLQGGKGRGASVPPMSAPAYYSAFLRVRNLIENNAQHMEALELAKSFCVQGNLTGLQLALSVARINAQKAIEDIEKIDALFPQPDIDTATEVYGE